MTILLVPWRPQEQRRVIQSKVLVLYIYPPDLVVLLGRCLMLATLRLQKVHLRGEFQQVAGAFIVHHVVMVVHIIGVLVVSGHQGE